MRVCVLGLGWVGLPTFHAMRRFHPETSGVDTNRRLVRKLAGAGLPVAVRAERPETVDAWILAVSTGSGLSALWQALASISPRPGATIVIESTIPPGTMQQVRQRFAGRGLAAGRDVFLVHCPHHVAPDREVGVLGTPRVIGGVSPACLEHGLRLYAPVTGPLTAFADVRVVELATVVESSLRYLNLAFAEDLKLYCDRVGIDFDDVRQAVNTNGDQNMMGVDNGIDGEYLPKDIGFLAEATHSPLLKAAVSADEGYRESLYRRLAGFQAVLIRSLSSQPGCPATGYRRALELARSLAAAGVMVGLDAPSLRPRDVRRLGFFGPDDWVYEAVVDRGRVTVNRPPGVEAGPGQAQTVTAAQPTAAGKGTD